MVETGQDTEHIESVCSERLLDPQGCVAAVECVGKVPQRHCLPEVVLNHGSRERIGELRIVRLPLFDEVGAMQWATPEDAYKRLVLGGARVAAIEQLREASLDFVDLEVGDLDLDAA